MPTKPGQVFDKAQCPICGKMITINGLGASSHHRKHLREKKKDETSCRNRR
jgi:hypothetical protein